MSKNPDSSTDLDAIVTIYGENLDDLFDMVRPILLEWSLKYFCMYLTNQVYVNART